MLSFKRLKLLVGGAYYVVDLYGRLVQHMYTYLFYRRSLLIKLHKVVNISRCLLFVCTNIYTEYYHA